MAVSELVSEIRRHRTTDGPFDVAIPSWTTTAPAGDYEHAGTTWWLEAFQPHMPLETAQTVVQRGPTPDIREA
jgi:hypothetical protein